MARLFARIRIIAAAFGLLIMTMGLASSPATAQVNPNASAMQEQQLLNQLKTIQGLGTIPDTRSYVLEHPAGRDWQYFHNVTLRWIAAIAILGFLAVIVIFYLVRGSVKLESGFSGRKIVRFNWFERFVHWMTAVCFIILGITGLNITIGGAVVAVTGYMLMFPFYGTTIDTMQRAEMVHGIATVLFIAFMLGHIYIGTVGMQGAYEAMGEGTVDINWAREHHSLWLEKETGRTNRPPSAVPAE